MRVFTNETCLYILVHNRLNIFALSYIDKVVTILWHLCCVQTQNVVLKSLLPEVLRECVGETKVCSVWGGEGFGRRLAEICDQGA